MILKVQQRVTFNGSNVHFLSNSVCVLQVHEIHALNKYYAKVSDLPMDSRVSYPYNYLSHLLNCSLEGFHLYRFHRMYSFYMLVLRRNSMIQLVYIVRLKTIKFLYYNVALQEIALQMYINSMKRFEFQQLRTSTNENQIATSRKKCSMPHQQNKLTSNGPY